MKIRRIIFRFSVVILMLVPVGLYATNWNTPDKGYFTGQTGIDAMEPFYIKAMATVSFENQIFHFSNYQDGGKGQILLRTLTNTGANFAINWTQVKTKGIANLDDLGKYNWQPAPVVYNNDLYLFVGNKSNGISYSLYNAGDSTWGPLVALPDFSNDGGNKLGFGMAAVVVDDRLCLVAQNYWSFIEIYTTTDTVNWTYFHDVNHSGRITSSGAADGTYGVVSAISQTYLDNGTKKSKLIYAYIDGNKHPRKVECSFDDNGNYNQISDVIISTERNYQSVAIVEGTVNGDPDSKGHCIQAFLKLDNKDNGYCRYRIQRWQSKEGASWTKQENNLVKQNYLWAHEYFNLCAVNFAIADQNNIRQFMCLIYCGYNDWDWPMNCAWAETDRLIHDPNGDSTHYLAGPENTQYIGYIEGPPPYHLNNHISGDSTDFPYIDPSADPISELGFETSSGSSGDSEVNCDVGGEVNLKVGAFNAGLSAAYGHVWGTEYSKTITHGINAIAQPEERGYYITLTPAIFRAQYFVNDVHGNRIDTTYYFTMTDPFINTESVDLLQGLHPGTPSTYHNRPGINFASFTLEGLGVSSVSWAEGAPAFTTITLNQSKSQTNTISGKLNLGAELGEFFDIGIDGSLDYTIKTTTSTGNSITAYTRLNLAKYPHDITHLNYKLYWINPVFVGGVDNWWLHDGAETQNTWCVTYEVLLVDTLNGGRLGDPFLPEETGNSSNGTANSRYNGIESGQFSSPGFSLSQNIPNPFNNATEIEYQVGVSNSPDGSSGQGCKVKLAVYNLNGMEVATLVNERKEPGAYTVTLDATGLAPGIYIYSLQSEGFSEMKKLVLLK